MYFPTTHWSVLAKATRNGDSNARSALQEVCQRYWAPLNRVLRLRGYAEAEAEDLTQEFLLHLIERSALRRPDHLRGKFRSFLLGALANFLSHKREHRLARKRGGLHQHVSVEALEADQHREIPSLRDDEVAAFDRAWAITVVRTALEQLEQEYAAGGKRELFGVLRAFLPGETTPPSYEEAAARANLSVPALTSELHRLRRHFRERICVEIRNTVSAPHEIDEEIAHLYHVLLDRGTDFRCLPERSGRSSVSN